MRKYEVRFDVRAVDDLHEIAAYIEEQSSARTAYSFVERIESKCKSLAHFPQRGTLRTDLGADLRTFGIDRRVTVLFRVDKDESRVFVLGVFYGGRDVRTD